MPPKRLGERLTAREGWYEAPGRPDSTLVELARERLLRQSPATLADDAARSPGAAFIAVGMGGLGIGLLVWLVVAMLFGVESPLALVAGFPIVLAWVSNSNQKEHRKRLEQVRRADPMTIVYWYCEQVSANENPDLWRALDDFRNRY